MPWARFYQLFCSHLNVCSLGRIVDHENIDTPWLDEPEEDAEEAVHEAFRQQQEKKHKIMSKLLLTLSGYPFDLVCSQVDPKAAITVLEEEFAVDPADEAFRLESLLRSRTMLPTESMKEFEIAVRSINTQIANLNEDKQLEDAVLMKLVATKLLPPKYLTVATTALHAPHQTIRGFFRVLNDVYETTSPTSSSRQQTPEQATAMGAFNNHERSAGTDCQRCGTRGHSANDCLRDADKIPRLKELKDKLGRRREHAKCVADFALTVTTPDESTTAFCFDTGATRHIHHDISQLDNITELERDVRVRTVSGEVLRAHQAGDMTVSLKTIDGQIVDHLLEGVLHIPELKTPLLSLTALMESNPSTNANLSPVQSSLRLDDNITVELHRDDRLFWLVPQPATGSRTADETGADFAALAETKPLTIQSIHERYNHAHGQRLKDIISTLDVKDKERLLKETSEFDCESCHTCKSRRQPINKTPALYSDRATRHLACDIGGPYPPSRNAFQYVLYLKDCASGFLDATFLHSKDEAPSALDRLIQAQAVMRPDGGKITVERDNTILTMDNDSVLTSQAMQATLYKYGITLRTSPASTQSQNGKAESAVGQMLTDALTHLHRAQLPKTWWPAAVLHSIYVSNSISYASDSKRRSPFEIVTGTSPQARLQRTRRFGCLAFAHIERSDRHKLDDRSAKCIYLGEDLSSQQHILFDPKSRTTRKSAHVTFFEGQNHKDIATLTVDHSGFEQPNPTSPQAHPPAELPALTQEALPATNAPTTLMTDNGTEVMTIPTTTAEDDPSSTAASTSTFVPSQKNIFKIIKDATAFHVEEVQDNEDQTFHDDDNNDSPSVREALAGPNREHWQACIDKELNDMKSRDTWTEVARNSIKPDADILRCHIILKRKRSPLYPGGVKYKARLVVMGTQQQVDDANDTYAPVIRSSSMRLLLSIAGAENWHAHVADVDQAFLASPINPKFDIHLVPPPQLKDIDPQATLLHLNKAVYGLKTSSKDFFRTLNKHFVTNEGFTACPSDQCVLYKCVNGVPIILLLYVDDVAFLSPSLGLIESTKAALSGAFDIKDLGPMHEYLGITIKRSPTGAFMLDQHRKITKAATALSVINATATYTPLPPGTVLEKIGQPCNPNEERLYKSNLGLLAHVGTQTRPDIAATISHLSRFMKAPNREHLAALRHLARYLYTTRDHPLVLGTTNDKTLEAQCDADYATDIDTSHSLSGAIYRFNGSTFAWHSTQLAQVTKSTCATEYVSASEASSSVIHFRELLAQIGYNQSNPTVLFNDNEAAIISANTLGTNFRTKQVRVRYHAIKEMVHNKELIMQHMPTKLLAADLLTKILPRPRTELHRRTIMGYPDSYF